MKILNQQISPREDQESGFTLIELLIVMSVILILMTLALPQLLKVHKQADETSAQASVRAIGLSETSMLRRTRLTAFPARWPRWAVFPGSGAPTPQAAQMVDVGLATGQKSGYLFNITNCTKVTVNNTDMFTGYELRPSRRRSAAPATAAIAWMKTAR